MKFNKTFIAPLVLIVACGLVLGSTYIEVKNRAIDQLNDQQLVLAETASRGIESFFEHYAGLLTQLSKMEEIASSGEQGRQLMRILYLTHADEIKAITRVSASGRIVCTFPETPGAIGTDLSSQEHIQRIMQTQRPVISEVFDSIQGLVAIAFHVPVHLGDTFWSIVVATPEDEVLSIMQGFKDKWFLVVGLMMLIMIVWSSYALRAFRILKEEEKRKRAETALIASEEKYRELVENANSIILRMDDSGKVTFFNEFAQRFFGYREEEIVGRDVIGAIVPEIESTGRDLKWMIEDISTNPEGYANNINENVCRNGERVWVAWTNRPILDKNGGVQEVLCIGNDITERKRAEEKLRESEERLRLTLEAINEGVWDWNIITGDAVFSPRWYTMLGYRPYEFPQNYDSWRSLVHPDDVVGTVQEMSGHIDSGDGYAVEMRMRTKSGDWRWILTRGMVVERDADGHPVRMVGTHSDVTERRKAEEERRRLEERLQRAEKMEALGTLAGGVAHDLNNVLGIVVGYSELLLDDLDESSPARSKAMEILKGGQRAAAIIQDLLTLARRGVPSRKVMNLNHIVMECQYSSEYAKLLSYHPKIEIETHVDSDLLNMSGSSIHLEKTLFNLVSNAAEAMPNGGTLTVRTANCYLDKPISGYDEVREGDYTVLSVSDTGEGISGHDLKRIFEPFYTKKAMGRSGTGLGLAVVWGTVKDHLGYINVESEKGRGTTFTLYFPVTREEITPEQVSISAAEYMGNGESILIVDDVKEQRELSGTMLKKLNYTVVGVPSGEEAVEYLKQNAVDLVVLDMIMDPGMDGLDTYIRILEIHPRQKAIIVSGFSETERVTKAQALGAGGYVKKPYALEKLGLAVKKELGRRA